LILFLSRAVVVGVMGATVGWGLGLIGTGLLRSGMDIPLVGTSGMVPWALLVACPLIGAGLGVIASWVPALIAAQQDPAVILKDR
jgi:ABC-type antimicrobial peptide transport system permease subunit